jgi:quinol monooxygenase YgiN
MYAAIRQAKLKPGTSEEVAKLTREGGVPQISAFPGFKSYYMVLGVDNAVTTVSVFEDKASAEKCNAQMLGWIKDKIGPYLAGPPQALEGQVIVHKG